MGRIALALLGVALVTMSVWLIRRALKRGEAFGRGWWGRWRLINRREEPFYFWLQIAWLAFIGWVGLGAVALAYVTLEGALACPSCRRPAPAPAATEPPPPAHLYFR